MVRVSLFVRNFKIFVYVLLHIAYHMDNCLRFRSLCPYITTNQFDYLDLHIYLYLFNFIGPYVLTDWFNFLDQYIISRQVGSCILLKFFAPLTHSCDGAPTKHIFYHNPKSFKDIGYWSFPMGYGISGPSLMVYIHM